MFATFDPAILENGQYNKRWRYTHLLRRGITGCKGTFEIDDSKKQKKENIEVVTLMIGEVINSIMRSRFFTLMGKYD